MSVFYEGVETVREATRQARIKDAQVAEIRRQVADIQRQVSRVQRSYQMVADRKDAAWGKVLAAAAILLSLRDLGAELAKVPPVVAATSVAHKTARIMIPQLAATAHGILLKDETARQVAGRYSGNAYAMAGVILKMAGKLPERASKRTGSGKRVTGATYEDRGYIDEAFRNAKPSTRTKEARSLVSAPKITTKSGATPTITATISSDAYDLENDRFTVAALRQMRDHLKGRLAFIGHRYTPPEDVFGTFTSTEIVKRGEYHELDAVIKVAVENPRALQVYELIKAGHRHGMSVGVLVREREPGEGKGQTDITSVVGLEASVVGIPANQAHGWTRRAD